MKRTKTLKDFNLMLARQKSVIGRKVILASSVILSVGLVLALLQYGREKRKASI